MIRDNIIAKILLPLPFNDGFTYFIKKEENPKIGDIFLIPFGKKKIFGIIIAILDEIPTDIAESKIKFSEEKLKDFALDPKLIEFFFWVANYNIAPAGLIAKSSIAVFLKNSGKKSSEIIVKINEEKEFPDKITEKRQKILDFLTNSSQKLENIKENTDFSLSLINKMAQNGLLIKEKQEIPRKISKIIQNINPNIFKLRKLSEKQQKIADQLPLENFQTSFLDGVTGSGKTEIYFYLISKILEQNSGQILFLLPEIILTTQLIRNFKDRFGFEAEIWHSKITASKKEKIFHSIISGDIRILIGTRSALFLPFKNLKAIIIDEEHDESFKQEDQISYHGRDMAIVRAKIENIPILLGSATPSLETYKNAISGKYKHLILTEKFSRNDDVKIEIIDLKEEKLEKDHFLSQKLLDQIALNLLDKKQSLLFLNKRGYASVTICKNCGAIVDCPNCSINITYHQKINRLICHHCGYNNSLPKKCSKCGAEDSFLLSGVGVEKIQEEIKSKFPTARIALMTSDEIKDLDIAKKIINQIMNDEIDIIIGTQMIAKGYHFPKLSLVGIIDGDASFYNNSLRTSERSYQLLTQIIGRAGREKYSGQVLIQSYNVKNPIFEYIIKQDRDKFLNQEIAQRKMLNLPPFGKMAEIIANDFDPKIAIETLRKILKNADFNKNIQILGPAPMAVTKVKNRYYYRLILNSGKNFNLQNYIQKIIKGLKLQNSTRVKIVID
jgi:primosomal protein N' (replication factor Y)